MAKKVKRGCERELLEDSNGDSANCRGLSARLQIFSSPGTFSPNELLCVTEIQKSRSAGVRGGGMHLGGLPLSPHARGPGGTCRTLWPLSALLNPPGYTVNLVILIVGRCSQPARPLRVWGGECQFTDSHKSPQSTSSDYPHST